MPKIRHALEVLERIAPKRYAFSFDRVGLQVGDPEAALTRAAVSLDRSLGAVQFAADRRCELLLAHHPLIFEPLEQVTASSHVGRTVLALARDGIAFAAAHTNWDSAQGGINDALASLFGLSEVTSFGTAAEVRRLKVIAFCPLAYQDTIIDAASGAGAGVIGEYSRCAFANAGVGTFLGSPRSSPAVGQSGQIECVDEVRVEMVLTADRRQAVDRAIRRVHPYEEPVVEFSVLAPHEDQPAGRAGKLPIKRSLRDLARECDSKLETTSWVWGDPSRVISRLAVVGGAADGEWRSAQRAGADALLTGEVKQHVALEAAEESFAIIASGHYATEQPGCAILRDRLASEMPDVEWLLYVPNPGSHGRPFVGPTSEGACV